ncbi:cytochrome P450 [Bacillus mangrovi]|uniref:Bifunctional cytochrome P450/NADPH--P450 reductase n=2 Tax=Metabacillus mangrovi TaxID=1491830 RepID=A0A7X2S223_9BACI|nr:cytochrome P450 [Metabacillus mangrovi]
MHMDHLKPIPRVELKNGDAQGPLNNPDGLVQSLLKVSKHAGPIFQFDRPRNAAIFLSSHRLVSEICDENRFDKSVSPALQNLRPFSGDGLFTSWTHEPNWKKAHHILLPAFSLKAMKNYHSMMSDIAGQLVQKWERLNAGETVDVSEDMTRLTLDTIGLCGFGYRFNSFYRTGFHPFIDSMNAVLTEAMARLVRPRKNEKGSREQEAEFGAHIQSMFNLVDRLIQDRKQLEQKEWPDDLLSHMLKSKDPETGERLDDENIRYQIMTFLIAGHETTGGMLSFALYLLCKNRRSLKAAREEADRILTSRVPSFQEVKKLKYIPMVLFETLRLWPTVPVISLYAKESEIVGGEYAIREGQELTVLLPHLHRDRTVWGEKAEEFIPERFEDMTAIPPHAFKPFGNGQRACIGQQFALHEAAMALSLLLKYFDFEHFPDYELKIKETLSWKPYGFKMKVKPRRKWTASPDVPPQSDTAQPEPAEAAEKGHHTPLLILYGSNMGTSEELALRLAEKGSALGYTAKAAPLDAYSGGLPREGAVLLLSSTYNGAPPDNAKTFVKWLEETNESLQGVRFAVFGCGDRTWSATFQRIPALIDKKMSEKGAEQICRLGAGDADEDLLGSFEQWEEEMWRALAVSYSLDWEPAEMEASVEMEFAAAAPLSRLAEKYRAFPAETAVNRELHQAGSPRSTRHLELLLPPGVSFREGGHIGIFPQNRPELIDRVLSRFRLTGNERVIFKGKSSHLPLNEPIEIRRLLADYPELQEPAAKSHLLTAIRYTECPPHRIELEKKLQNYEEEVVKKRVSLLEILEAYNACELPFERFFRMLPPLKPRFYSIASSPEADPGRISLTVRVVKEKAWNGSGFYEGTASHYLAGLQPGDPVACFIKEQGFQKPEDPSLPLIMVAGGSGIAPFLGFLQGRSILQKKGVQLGEAHLFFGCRSLEEFLYKEKLEEAERNGLVTLYPALSREPGKDRVYVQDVLKQHAAKIIRLLDEDASCLYICGRRGMSIAAEQALLDSCRNVKSAAPEEAAAWLEALVNQGRYSKDVWG